MVKSDKCLRKTKRGGVGIMCWTRDKDDVDLVKDQGEILKRFMDSACFVRARCHVSVCLQTYGSRWRWSVRIIQVDSMPIYICKRIKTKAMVSESNTVWATWEGFCLLCLQIIRSHRSSAPHVLTRYLFAMRHYLFIQLVQYVTRRNEYLDLWNPFDAFSRDVCV